MPFIVTAIGAIGSAIGAASAFVSGLGFFTKMAIGLAVSLGLNALSKALQPKPKAGSALTGVETSVQIGGDIARQIVVGRCATKGQLVYHNTNGSENQYYQQVYALSDWISKELVSVIINGEKKQLTVAEVTDQWIRYGVAGHYGISFTFYNGAQTAADPSLIANANPSGKWDINSRLTNITYVYVFYQYDKDNPLYESGLPDLTFEIDGAVLYDWRKDDTNGGSGDHRWDNPATWEYSNNPVVATYNFQRGFFFNGQKLVGMGTQPYDIIHETYTTAANICDEMVVTTGPVEKRYVCSIILTADQDVQYSMSLDALLSTYAGYLYDYGGAYYCQAGAAQMPADEFSDADRVQGLPVTFAAKRSRADLVNKIFGQYLDAENDYQEQSYPPQEDENAEVNDGEELGRQLDLLAVPSKTQAERIARIRLRESRCQATASVTLGFNFMNLQVGDWVVWNSAMFGTRTWRIMDRALDNSTKRIALELAEINASVFSWSAADEGISPAQPIGLIPGQRPATVSNFEVFAEAILNADQSVEVPALRFTWNQVTDSTIDAVVIEYRQIGSDAKFTVVDDTPEDGIMMVTQGIVNATNYEARATIRTTPARATIYTPWTPVRTTDNYNVNAIAVLAAELKRQVEIIMPSRVRDVEERLLELGAIAGDIDAGYAITSQKIRRELRGRIANVVAYFQEEIEIAFGPESAFAQAITELYAAIDNVEANIKVRFVVAATPEGALAAYELKAMAGTSYAGMTVIAESEQESYIMLDADRFQVRVPNELGGDPIPVFGIAVVDGVPKIALAGAMVADGSITANKIVVGQLSAISANLGEITAGRMVSPDGLMEVNLTGGYILISENI